MALNLSEQIGGHNLQNVSKNSNGFIQHVTRFDTETKSELSNLLQYLVIVIVPIYILNRTINGVIPDFNEPKGNIELLGEVGILGISILILLYISYFNIIKKNIKETKQFARFILLSLLLMILFFQSLVDFSLHTPGILILLMSILSIGLIDLKKKITD